MTSGIHKLRLSSTRQPGMRPAAARQRQALAPTLPHLREMLAEWLLPAATTARQMSSGVPWYSSTLVSRSTERTCRHGLGTTAASHGHLGAAAGATFRRFAARTAGANDAPARSTCAADQGGCPSTACRAPSVARAGCQTAAAPAGRGSRGPWRTCSTRGRGSRGGRTGPRCGTCPARWPCPAPPRWTAPSQS